MNKRKAVESIESPMKRFGVLLDTDIESYEIFAGNEKLPNYSLNEMVPKVTYDEFGVWQYLKDGKFYYIDEKDVVEVEPVEVAYPDSDGRYYDENGRFYVEDTLRMMLDCFFTGEADDLSCYVYFNQVDKK